MKISSASSAPIIIPQAKAYDGETLAKEAAEPKKAAAQQVKTQPVSAGGVNKLV
ncbi:MAG: hypothetical protein K2Q32_02775 [Alphaproteobacteria bacterium]|nr:hypothetical protein [Alphaproteobacteria bacterium]